MEDLNGGAIGPESTRRRQTGSCGFQCVRNALCALNVVYILVGIILISVGAYAHEASVVSSVSIAVGIICVGVFLACVALLGLYGTHKHHQVALFFYMIILFSIFVVQFCVAVACMAVSDQQLRLLITQGWHRSHNATRLDAEQHFDCCGLNKPGDAFSVACETLACAGSCPACLSVVTRATSGAAQLAGGIGIFFSFTEIIGIWLAMKYRNLKDPSVNPDLYL